AVPARFWCDLVAVSGSSKRPGPTPFPRTSMNALQARMFIEQILAQPSIPAATQLVQANLSLLDATFFMVLQQLIQQEQATSVGNWGGSVEDRIAERMAHLNSPSAPSQRLQALQMLLNYAGQLCQQQAVAQLLGFSP